MVNQATDGQRMLRLEYRQDGRSPVEDEPNECDRCRGLGWHKISQSRVTRQASACCRDVGRHVGRVTVLRWPCLLGGMTQHSGCKGRSGGRARAAVPAGTS